MKHLFCILLLVLLASCVQVKKRLDLSTSIDETGVGYIEVKDKDSSYFEAYWNGLDDNGFRLKSSLPDGRYDVFLDDTLHYRAHYKNNQKSKVWSYYFAGSEQAYHTVTYVNGKRNGASKMYNKSGVLIETGQYKDDKKEGVWTGYSEDGKTILSKIYYRNDQMYKLERFRDDGSIKMLKEYDDRGKATTTIYDDKGNEINNGKR